MHHLINKEVITFILGGLGWPIVENCGWIIPIIYSAAAFLFIDYLFK